jgi:hypothetical protein
MTEIYLDQQKKNYYYSDFKENVLPESDNFWKLSEFIKPHLIELNENKKIQPLYSKFPDNNQSMERNQSYLEIAYTKDIELILFRKTLPYFVNKYNHQEESKFYYTFSAPKDNEISESKLGCLSNPDYYRINRLCLYFECYVKNKHKEFWQDLKDRLKSF